MKKAKRRSPLRRADRFPAPSSATPAERERWIEIEALGRARKGARIECVGANRVRALIVETVPSLETRVFGLKRIHFDIVPVPECTDGAERILLRVEERIPPGSCASLRLPGDAGPLAWRFQEAGWLWADLSIDYAFTASPESLPGPWTVRPVKPGERSGLARALARSLSDGRLIRTRFTTDRALAPHARELYDAWALERLASVNRSEVFGWTVREPGRTAAGCLIASRVSGDDAVARIELNAVFPGMRSRGAYTALAAQSLEQLFAAGFREIRVRTSGSTLSVQRVWQRLGGRPRSSDIVLHRPASGRIRP